MTSLTAIFDVKTTRAYALRTTHACLLQQRWRPRLLLGGYIDLSFVDKQTALVGMLGRKLVKHSFVLTGVLTKLIFCKLSIK